MAESSTNDGRQGGGWIRTNYISLYSIIVLIELGVENSNEQFHRDVKLVGVCMVVTRCKLRERYESLDSQGSNSKGRLLMSIIYSYYGISVLKAQRKKCL